MKALILHASRWEVNVESPSLRIGDCEPEELHYDINDDEGTGEGPPHPIYALATEHMEECLVVLFHVEKGDSVSQVNLLSRDTRMLAEKMGTRRIMLSGFRHLSSSHCEPAVAKELYLQLLALCKEWNHYEVRSSHFGWNKALLLDTKGHPTAFNFRDYPSSKDEAVTVHDAVKEERRSGYQAGFKSQDEKAATREARLARRAARREEQVPEGGK